MLIFDKKRYKIKGFNFDKYGQGSNIRERVWKFYYFKFELRLTEEAILMNKCLFVAYLSIDQGHFE
jgi:hypothetical protein